MTAVVRAEEELDLGVAEVTVEDVLSDWQRASYDVAASTVGVFDGDRLVAFGDLSDPGIVYSAVHPDAPGPRHRHRDRGLARGHGPGPRLDADRRPGAEGRAADRLMAGRGYVERWTAWDLELPEGTVIEAQPLPAGYAIRDARPDDHEAGVRA